MARFELFHFCKELFRQLRRFVFSCRSEDRFHVAPFPPSLSIETTNLCGAKCVFCSYPQMKRKKESLTMDAFKKLVDRYAEMGGRDLNFCTTLGDPLLDKSLLARVRYAVQYDCFRDSIGFYTTLQWLHRFDLEEFFESGIAWLHISICLSGRISYKEFFGVDLYEQTVRNLIALLEENQRRGERIKIYIDVKPTRDSSSEIVSHPDFKRVDELAADDLVVRLKKHYSCYVDDWLGEVELPSYLKKRPLIPRRKRPCRLLYTGITVFSNGNIGACHCRDAEANSELVVGNVETDDLQDVWVGSKLTSIRTQWREANTVPEMCRVCRHYQP